MYRWIVFNHVARVLVFLRAHGASAVVSFRLKNERDPERLRALLDLSSASIGSIATWIPLGVVILTGVVLGFMGGWWGQWWIGSQSCSCLSSAAS